MIEKIFEELKEIASQKIWEDTQDQAQVEEKEATMGYGPDFEQPSAKDKATEAIKRKSEEDIENDTLDLSDQLLKTKDKQHDYEEKVADLITKIVDKEEPVNTLIKYIIKNKRKFVKKK